MRIVRWRVSRYNYDNTIFHMWGADNDVFTQFYELKFNENVNVDAYFYTLQKELENIFYTLSRFGSGLDLIEDK